MAEPPDTIESYIYDDRPPLPIRQPEDRPGAVTPDWVRTYLRARELEGQEKLRWFIIQNANEPETMLRSLYDAIPLIRPADVSQDRVEQCLKEVADKLHPADPFEDGPMLKALMGMISLPVGKPAKPFIKEDLYEKVEAHVTKLSSEALEVFTQKLLNRAERLTKTRHRHNLFPAECEADVVSRINVLRWCILRAPCADSVKVGEPSCVCV